MQDKDIEEEVNCPRNTVIYVRRKMGLLRTTWGGPRPSVDVPAIKELYLKGVDVAQIAKQMECSKTTVYRWLQLKKHRGIVEAE
ncbi:MAG: helix-turn-helix domain-containing protein [Parabacteroides sp.]|nr:helix-turn-helix domain-containing protein [Parabacteroides sp.]